MVGYRRLLVGYRRLLAGKEGYRSVIGRGVLDS